MDFTNPVSSPASRSLSACNRSSSWSVCTTAKEDILLLRRFVDHHTALGASQVYVHLDRPDSETLQWAESEPKATITICDKYYYNSLPTNIRTHVAVQMYNFRTFLHAHCTTEWSIHIDADEFVSSEQDVAHLLGQLQGSIDTLQLLPAEPVFTMPEAGEIMKAYGQTLARLSVCRAGTGYHRLLDRGYGKTAGMIRNGLVGHSAGKTFVRRGGPISRFRLHHTRADSPKRHRTADQSVLRLLHYDAVDPAHFMRKMNSRLSMTEGHMGKGRELLQSRFRQTARCIEDTAAMQLFCNLYALDKRQIALLESCSALSKLDPNNLQFIADNKREKHSLHLKPSNPLVSLHTESSGRHLLNMKLVDKMLQFDTEICSPSPEQSDQRAKRLFVILTQARSGSYLLVDLLNQVPDIRCHPEIFKPGRLELAQDLKQHINWTIVRRDERPILYMKRIFSIGNHAATGFKLFPGHNGRLLAHVTAAKYIHKIVLLRHPISRYISRLRAEATGRWVEQVKNPDEQASSVSLIFDPSRFELFLQQHNRFVADNVDAAAAHPEAYTLIDYEEVVSFRALERICRSLGVQPVDTSTITPSLQKQTKEPLPELVSNYNEMKAYLVEKHPGLLEQPGCPRLE